MDEIKFDGRVAVITGAGGGLGREYALELARRGAKVVVNDLGVSTAGSNPSSVMADRVVAEINDNGGTAVANYDNIATRDGGSSLIRQSVEAFGRVDAVIINAGLIRPMRFEDQTDQIIDLILNVHVKQGFYVGQPAYRQMKEQKYGRFVFMGSAVGMFGDAWQAPYAAGKAGLFALSNVISLEGKRHGILSNVVLPTAHSRMEEQLKPDAHVEVSEIGDMVAAMDFAKIGAQMTPAHNVPITVYLASEKSTSSHGVFSSVGGRYARVSVSVSKGWSNGISDVASVEDVGAHWNEIADVTPYGRPMHVMDEFRILIESLKS